MGKPSKKSQSDPSWTAAKVPRPQADPAQHEEQSPVDQLADENASAADSNSAAQPNPTTPLDDQQPRAADESVNAQTCCSNCQTVFEVSAELLSSTDTRVRCGECLSIFDALANLRDTENRERDEHLDVSGNTVDSNAAGTPLTRRESDRDAESDSYHEASSLPDAGAAALAGLANDTSSLDVTYSDFDLFSDEAGLPEVAYFDQTRDATSFDFDNLDEDEETFSDTLFAQDVTVDARVGDSEGVPDFDTTQNLQNIVQGSEVDYITDDAPREPLIFKYRDRESSSQSSNTASEMALPLDSDELKGAGVGLAQDIQSAEAHHINVPEEKNNPWLLRGALILLVAILAAGLYLYRERDALYTNHFVRPVLESACSVLKCTLPERTDLAAIKVLKRAVFSHPTIEKALIIDLAFINEAAFSQPYPILEIRLTDRSGHLVVRNSFLPSDYLSTWHAGDQMDVGKRLDISLSVEDPGQTATSFELDFR